MTEKFKNLWKDGTADDPFDDADPDEAVPKQDYLHADMAVVVMPMDAVAKVWVRLLQLQCMRPRDRHVLLGQRWLTQHGVTRYAKYRALRKLEAAGLIRAVRSDHRGPRVEILVRAGRSQNRKGGRSQNRTGSQSKPHRWA